MVNRLEGRDGSDDLDGREGADVMIGGKGNDRYTVDTAGYYDTVVSTSFALPGGGVTNPFPYIPGDQVTELANEGIDSVSSYITYTLPNEVEHLQLLTRSNLNGFGNARDNSLTGNVGVNRLEGRGGNDTIDGRAGEDIMVGGTGDDMYFVDDNTGPGLTTASFGIPVADVIYSPGDQVIENANEGFDRIFTTVDYTLPNHVEFLALAGAAGNINGSGNSLANTIFGNEGQNRLNGAAGNDLLDGQGGADTMSGGLGDDAYSLDTPGVFIRNTRLGTGGTIYLPGDQVFENANEGKDRVYAPFSYTLTANVEELALTGAGNLNGFGNASDNGLFGSTGANRLEAYAGNDFLNGLEGADTMVGGTGNDRYRVDNSGDVVVENAGEGTDTIEASISYVLPNHVENMVWISSAALSNASAAATIYQTGNALANLLVCNDGANILNGKAGADTMQGKRGNDSYFVDNASDKVVEAAGQGTDNVNTSVSYTLGTSVSVETLRTTNVAGTAAINLTGNNLANIVTGNAGANIINGGASNDVLAGMSGRDKVTGGAGSDLFVFNTALNAATNVDTVTDFSVAYDTFRLENAVFTTLTALGRLAADAFHIGAAAADAEDRIIYNQATGALSYDANGTGAGGLVKFAQLTAGLGLTNADFVIV